MEFYEVSNGFIEKQIQKFIHRAKRGDKVDLEEIFRKMAEKVKIRRRRTRDGVPRPLPSYGA